MFTIQWRLALVVAVLIPIFALVVTTQHCKRMAAVSKEVPSRRWATSIRLSPPSRHPDGQGLRQRVLGEHSIQPNWQNTRPQAPVPQAMARFSSTMEFFLCILQVAVIAFGGF